MKAESPEQPGPPTQLDALLDQLEVLIGRLADPNAPLDRLVADFEAASRLVEAAQAQVAVAADRIAQQER